MTDRTEDSGEIEKLYEYCEKLNEAKDKSLNKVDYEGIITAANGSVKPKQLAAQMIPKFFKFFPDISEQALDQHLYLREDEELGVRVQAIRGLPFFCKDTPEHLAKIVDILGQLLVAGDNVERDAVHKALVMLLQQDVKKNIPDDTTNNHTTSDPGESLFMMVVQHQYKLAELVKSYYGSGQKRRSINRDRAAGHTQLVNDYFSAEPVYTDDIFRRRFRMRKELFLRIVNALENHPDGYFKWREDAARRKGLSPLQKCTVAIRQLAYGGPTCQLDEYLRTGVTTALECLSNFCQCVMQIYGSVYLRKPNAFDIARLLPMHEQRHGFPGMLGSLD